MRSQDHDFERMSGAGTQPGHRQTIIDLLTGRTYTC